jgi:hypothetical protein
MLHFLSELGELPQTIVVGLLRALWWLGWDFCVRTVGWSIGWIFLRAITLGRFPAVRISQLDDSPVLIGILVEVLGLALLAACIFAVTQSWPRP